MIALTGPNAPGAQVVRSILHIHDAETYLLTAGLATAFTTAVFVHAQDGNKFTAATLPTANLLSEPGPTFRIKEQRTAGARSVSSPMGMSVSLDPSNVKATDPRVRQWLVKRIAEEKPVAVILNGDVPLAGDQKNDYAVFQTETKPWRDAHLRVYPTLGNHEFHGDPQKSLDNWWDCFPEMRNRRWYSAQFGSRVYMIALDTDTSLLPGSDQARWIAKQIDDLPASIDFVIFTLHHPPVADVQEHIEVSTIRAPERNSLEKLPVGRRQAIARAISGQRGPHP